MSDQLRTTQDGRDALEARLAEMLPLLERQIAIPSTKAEPEPGAPYGADTRRALEDFLETAAADGFRTRMLDGHAGWIEYGPEGDAPIVAAVCHLDVVPAGDWAEAFSPRLEGTRVYGRGSADDKGPAVSCYYALLDLKRRGYTPSCRLRLILGLDEESGSACMQHYNAVDEAPAAAFTADACFPVIHAEKGLLQFGVSLEHADVAADAGLQLIAAEAGTRANVIPGQCRLRWRLEDGSELVEDIAGAEGHASTPENGVNAISLAMEAAAARLDEAGRTHPFVSLYRKLIARTTDGSLLGVALSDEVSGKLTFNVGIIALDAARTRLVCDIRYPVTHDGEALIAALRKRVEAEGAKLEVLNHSAPLYLPLDHPLVATLTEVYRAAGGENTEPVAIGGGTYARALPNTVAFGNAFPGDEELAHQRGEYIDLVQLERARAIYADAFVALDEAYGTAD